LLSDRRNIVVIADEAHRSQYDFIDGFADTSGTDSQGVFHRIHGNPIELNDRNTKAVLGYISVYDIERAVEDHTTVKIYYEGRLAKLELAESREPRSTDLRTSPKRKSVRKSSLKRKWSRLEAMVGTEKRLKLIAKDIVEHFEKRQEAMDGKAMIVCMSRRICVDLYEQIVNAPRLAQSGLRQGSHQGRDDRLRCRPRTYAQHLMTPKSGRTSRTASRSPKTAEDRHRA
jgi:type I restriction enzyme R subunit